MESTIKIHNACYRLNDEDTLEISVDGTEWMEIYEFPDNYVQTLSNTDIRNLFALMGEAKKPASHMNDCPNIITFGQLLKEEFARRDRGEWD